MELFNYSNFIWNSIMENIETLTSEAEIIAEADAGDKGDAIKAKIEELKKKSDEIKDQTDKLAPPENMDGSDPKYFSMEARAMASNIKSDKVDIKICELKLKYLQVTGEEKYDGKDKSAIETDVENLKEDIEELTDYIAEYKEKAKKK